MRTFFESSKSFPLIFSLHFRLPLAASNILPITNKATKAIYPKRLRYYPNANKNQYRSLNDNYDERMKYVKQIERTLSARKLTPVASSPEMAHHNFFGFHRQAIQLGRKGEHAIHRALDIAKNYLNEPRPTKTLYELLASYSTNINNSTVPDETGECPKDPPCTAFSRYRSADGTCNNLKFPQWGKAFSPYNRVLNPAYGDGINSPRLSKAKEELPNVRDLSVELTRQKFPPSSKLTLVAMQFGQFIDHDIVSSSSSRNDTEIQTFANAFHRLPPLRLEPNRERRSVAVDRKFKPIRPISSIRPALRSRWPKMILSTVNSILHV